MIGRAALMAAALAACAAPGAAQQVQDCGWYTSAAFLAEPWAENTRTFANGAVRIALIDTVEPAAGAYRLLILSPPYSELGERQCAVVGGDEGGFSAFRFNALEAGYDPARGLIFSAPINQLVAGDFEPGVLTVVLNQATGEITARVDP